MEHTVIQREIAINGTVIHIKSIFTAQTTLDEAVRRIIVCRFAEAKTTIPDLMKTGTNDKISVCQERLVVSSEGG